MTYGLEGRRTIFALATGMAKSAIAVIRISGPATKASIELLMRTRVPKPRRATLCSLTDPESGLVIDNGIVVWFPRPNSYTGEDSAELQVHGARSVITALLRVLGRMGDLRAAGPGEFARRSLENGKTDLIGIEALGDLIDSETEQQRRFAISQASGGLQAETAQWRTRLIDALVSVEGELDFSDESDVPKAWRDGVRAICGEILTLSEALTTEKRKVECLRYGMTVLLAGPPNAGKSTLMNAISKREIAIVSERAGTTRDLIEVRLNLGGFPVNVIDTAGIRASEDPIEREGIDRALKKGSQADLVLWLTASDASYVPPPGEFNETKLWHILTKADFHDRIEGLGSGVVGTEISGIDESFPESFFKISAKTGLGIGDLIERLGSHATASMSMDGSLIVANERQYAAISMMQNALRAILESDGPAELVAEDLRRACFSLESLIGKIGVEDILDQLFARFCIGK